MAEEIKLAIIGTGPAGYTAGLYSARAQLAPMIFAGLEMGGQLMYTNDVENFPGFVDGVKGLDLMMTMGKQAEKFGAKVEYKFISAVDFSHRPFQLWTSQPTVGFEVYKRGTPEEVADAIAEVKRRPADYTAEAVIVATGATSIMLGVPGEDTFFAKGVSTCAVCDAAFFKDKVTYVVGGGDSAMEDALALAKFATSVTVIHRRSSFRASKIMQERVLQHPKISVMWNSKITKIKGDTMVKSIVVRNQDTAIGSGFAILELPADGVFIAIGHKPMTRIFEDQLELDQRGYIVTRQSATRWGVDHAKLALDVEGMVSFPSMTSVEGVFAAGDVVDVRYKQAVTSAGQGCMASLDAERWLERQEA